MLVQIPGYQVERELGRGGMASVYLATQLSVDRPVALKVMAGHLGDEAIFRERFVREGKLVARLAHPNIITIYDIGAADDLLYIAMEYISGGDLHKRLAKGALSWLEAVRVLRPLAQALHMAHQQQIIHRDIKPHNILFRADGQPVLADFGIAKLVGSQTLTQTGAVVGTAAYMAPEQALGDKVDGRADLYSLGVVFYEMLVGQRPYDADTVPALLMQHIAAPIPRLPAAQAPAQGILDKLLAKQPADRYLHGAELAAALEALEHQQAPALLYSSADAATEIRAPEPIPEPPARQRRPVIQTRRREPPVWPWLLGLAGFVLISAGALWLGRHELVQALGLVPRPVPERVEDRAHKPVPELILAEKPAQDVSVVALSPPSDATPGSATGFYDSIKGGALATGVAQVPVSSAVVVSETRDPVPVATTATPAVATDVGVGQFLGQQGAATQASSPGNKTAQAQRKAAEAGNVRAQVQLGWYYQQGEQGLIQDDAAAARWYALAVAKGDAEAQMYLGWLTQEGRGVGQDYARAAELFAAAGKQGNAQAQMYLGWLYQEGNGVAQDYEQAADWYRKAADQGNAQAQMYLGWLYQEGKGAPQNDRLAARWYQKAADQGNAQAQLYLGWLYQEGRGVKQDHAAAARWYRKAIAGGNAEAQGFLDKLPQP